MILLATLITIYLVGYVASIKATNHRSNHSADLNKMRSETPGFYYSALIIVALFWPVLFALSLVRSLIR